MKPFIIAGRPPIFDMIARTFPLAHRPSTVFAYHDTIYVASGNLDLPEYLIRHETVHLERQGGTREGANEWWIKYLANAEFRYNEELLAHIEEYKCVSENGSRQQRRAALRETVKRLTSPLYRFDFITQARATQDILMGAAQ